MGQNGFHTQQIAADQGLCGFNRGMVNVLNHVSKVW